VAGRVKDQALAPEPDLRLVGHSMCPRTELAIVSSLLTPPLPAQAMATYKDAISNRMRALVYDAMKPLITNMSALCYRGVQNLDTEKAASFLKRMTANECECSYVSQGERDKEQP
jgi:hypothetical protein